MIRCFKSHYFVYIYRYTSIPIAICENLLLWKKSSLSSEVFLSWCYENPWNIFLLGGKGTAKCCATTCSVVISPILPKLHHFTCWDLVIWRKASWTAELECQKLKQAVRVYSKRYLFLFLCILIRKFLKRPPS